MWYLSLLHWFFFLVISESRLLCGDSEVYVLAQKQCQDSCSKESFHILHDGKELYASPLFEDYELRSLEICLPSVEYDQYQIQISNVAGMSWSAGSWLEIQNEDGVSVFKTFMTNLYEEVYPLSLYRPIMKNAIWKLTFGSITGTWKAYDYADSAWSSVVLGSVSVEVTGTQYLRRKFKGVSRMAAYDLSLLYSQGIIAYINGVEILRDNLPPGAVQSGTPATGSYYSDAFHSVVRPGLEISASNVLAVELHFIAGSHVTACTFNGFLALLAPSVGDAPCWVLPQASVGSSLRGSNVERAFNFNKEDGFTMTPFAPLTLHFTLDTFVRAKVNALRVWPSTEVTKTPRSFSFRGLAENAGEVAPMIRVADAKYRSNRFASFFGFFHTGLFASFALEVTQSNDVDLTLFETQPMVCSLPQPAAISFDAAQFVGVVGVEFTPIVPSVYGFTQCSILPALPAGLSLDRDACSVTGRPAAPLLTTEFTVTSVAAGGVSGKFLLTVTEAVGTTLLVTRSFAENPADESFALVDAESGERLFGIPVNGGQQPGSEVAKVLHVTCRRVRVELGSLGRAWAPGSFLSVAVVLSGLEKETLLRATYDEYLGLPAFHELNVRYPVPPNDAWLCWPEGLPARWFGNDTDGWQKGRREEFPAGAGRLRLFKHVVTLPALGDVAGFTLGLRYQFGAVVLVNGVEVFRDNVEGPLSETAAATGGYANLFYHLMSFPLVNIPPGEKAPHTYLHEGANVVAVALVGQTDNRTLSAFDCTLNLLASSQSRVWDFSVTSAACFAGNDLFAFSHQRPFVGSNCPQGDVLLTFENSRREWVSSVVVQIALDALVGLPSGFDISARNPGDAAWTVLARVRGLTWFAAGQRTRVWLENRRAYNQYRVGNFSGDAKIQLSSFDLVADRLEPAVPVFTYSGVTVFSGVPMAEVYPSSPFFTGFAVTPTLPQGLRIDPYSGVLHGASTLKGFSGYFTVTARTPLGQEAAATFLLKVDACAGKRALLDVIVQSSGVPENEQLAIYEGSKSEWRLLRSVSSIPSASPVATYAFCLNAVLHKLVFQEVFVHRRQVVSGYSLQFAGTDFVFDARYLHETVATHAVESTFSAATPFMMNASKWRLCLEPAPTGRWTSYNYDDSLWREVLPRQLPSLQMITLYLRRSFHLSRLSELSVLNVRMCYVGGAVVYLNGVTVARFLLDSHFDASTPGESNANGRCSVFHVVLATSGARDGANTLAVEMHRPETTSLAWFDAVGVFGVESCARVLDSVSVVETGPQVADAQRLFQVGSFEYAALAHSEAFVTWRVENAMGSHFNTYAITAREDYAEMGFELWGREETTDQWVEMALGTNRTLQRFLPASQAVPVGAVEFREFRWELTRAVAMSHRLLSLAFYYCRTSGIVCPAMGDFPAVSDGQISPALCEEGFVGYRYKECHGGQFGETRTEKCFYRVPESLSYGSDTMEFVLNVPSQSVQPTFRYVVKRFTMDAGKRLPLGLQLNGSTGVIEGTPLEEVLEEQYKIYAENPSGAKSVVVRITVRRGYCKGEGLLPYRCVGETAEYPCRDAGFAFGKLVKKCVLGETDGVWEHGGGVCISYWVLVLCFMGAVSVAAGAVYLVIRQQKRKERKRRTTRHRLVSEGNRIIVY